MKRSLLLLFVIFLNCGKKEPSVNETLSMLEHIPGKEAYKATPYITPGDRLYAIGAQDGSFPEIGWHINNEMGGIWNHPVKIMDGFRLTFRTDSTEFPLNNADFLNYPFGNKFLYTLKEAGLSAERVQFVPDQKQGMVIEYTLSNENDTELTGNLQFRADMDLRPTWLGERSGMIDATDSLYFLKDLNSLVAKDRNNDWYGVVSASEPINTVEIGESPYLGKGSSGILNIPVRIPPKTKKKISFFLSSSLHSLPEALEQNDVLKQHTSKLLEQKMNRTAQIAATSQLTTSDPDFDTIFRWLKYNSEWFIREVPEHGRGIAAGYPDYPWWFGCDSEFALQGYLAIGNFEITRSTLELLASLSRKTNPNGRIIHEASTNGVVFNPGNVNETPQFVSLLWEYYLWTGDQTLLRDHFDLVQKGLQWLTEDMDTNRNGFPEGSGMMEIHGLDSEMIDVASYAQKGLEDGARIARKLGKTALASEYEAKAQELKTKINADFWVDDFNSFGDFIANDPQTLRLIEDAIVRADTLNKPWAVKELEQTKAYLLANPSSDERPFVLHHNWVVNTPMEMGIAEEEKAQQALKTARTFVNPFGVFVTGIDRDASAGKEIGSFKGSKVFSYTGAVMTLPTGVSAVAENNYGHPDQALDYLERMGRSFSYALPGSMYEVSPDYGMFAQAWNLYSYAVPVVRQFFGIRPYASEKRITIKPLMPSKWEFASLEKVKVGDNEISVSYERTTQGYSLHVTQKLKDWDLEIKPTKGFTLIKEKKESAHSRSFTYQKNDRQ